MKSLALLPCLAVLFLTPPLQAQTGAVQTVEKEGVSLDVPKDWKPETTDGPIVHMVTDPTNTYSVIVVREVKADMGVEDLKEYYDFKLEKLGAAWQSPTLGEGQDAVIHGNKTRWTSGTATMVDPQGIKIPSNVLFATVEGKDNYYFLLMSARSSRGAAGSARFPAMLNSFKAP